MSESANVTTRLFALARHLDGRITRAIAALDAAPDVDPAQATRAQVTALHAANLAAWAILTEGRDPPSRRGTDASDDPSATPRNFRVVDGDREILSPPVLP